MAQADVSMDSRMIVNIPDSGTPERAALVRAIAARMWAGRDDRPFAEVGEYWEQPFLQLAEDALAALERHGEASKRPEKSIRQSRSTLKK